MAGILDDSQLRALENAFAEVNNLRRLAAVVVDAYVGQQLNELAGRLTHSLSLVGGCEHAQSGVPIGPIGPCHAPA